MVDAQPAGAVRQALQRTARDRGGGMRTEAERPRLLRGQTRGP